MKNKKSNFIPTLKYIWTTIKHKWYVFNSGLKLNVPIWQLIVHDLSKFNIKRETVHYGRQFFGTKDDPIGFSYAWNHHQKNNKHHWEYWIPASGRNTNPLPMPRRYAREMVADWLGASKAYEGEYPNSLNSWKWYQSNFQRIKIHLETRIYIIMLLEQYFSKLNRG